MTLTGGSASYYKITVEHPTHQLVPYVVEVNDIIETLGMTYAEGNVLKAVIRHALARKGVGKEGNTRLYEAQKAKFFSDRLVALAEVDEDE